MFDHLLKRGSGGSIGRMFIYFVGLIFALYVCSVWQRDDVFTKEIPVNQSSDKEKR